MASLNKATLIGNVGKDPEIRMTKDGREIASFSLATSDVWKDKSTGEKREKTEWHKIVVFSPPLIELIKKYVKKGRKLYVEGSIQTRKWMDQNNAERYTTEIALQGFNSVLILLDESGTNRQFGEDAAENSGEKHFEVEDDINDNIPF